MMKKIDGVYRVVQTNDDIFISALLICCAFEKIHWGFFWGYLILTMMLSDTYEKEAGK